MTATEVPSLFCINPILSSCFQHFAVFFWFQEKCHCVVGYNGKTASSNYDYSEITTQIGTKNKIHADILKPKWTDFFLHMKANRHTCWDKPWWLNIPFSCIEAYLKSCKIALNYNYRAAVLLYGAVMDQLQFDPYWLGSKLIKPSSAYSILTSLSLNAHSFSRLGQVVLCIYLEIGNPNITQQYMLVIVYIWTKSAITVKQKV